MLDAETRFEFFTHETRTIVGDNHLWKPEFVRSSSITEFDDVEGVYTALIHLSEHRL